MKHEYLSKEHCILLSDDGETVLYELYKCISGDWFSYLPDSRERLKKFSTARKGINYYNTMTDERKKELILECKEYQKSRAKAKAQESRNPSKEGADHYYYAKKCHMYAKRAAKLTPSVFAGIINTYHPHVRISVEVKEVAK